MPYGIAHADSLDEDYEELLTDIFWWETERFMRMRTYLWRIGIQVTVALNGPA